MVKEIKRTEKYVIYLENGKYYVCSLDVFNEKYLQQG